VNIKRHQLIPASAQLFVAAGFLLAIKLAPLHAEPDSSSRIARLIRQLGDDSFAEREAATTELTAIGEPALEALRTAVSDDDPEVRWRAKWLVEEIVQRVELAKCRGFWSGSKGVWMKFSGDRWSSGTPTFGPISGRTCIRGREEQVIHVDLLVDDGPMQGQTCLMIWRLEGEMMECCWTYDSTRPTEFKMAGNWFANTFTREKAEPAIHEVRENVIP